MSIKDIDKRTIPLFFYINERGSELMPLQVQKGYTVAVFYAKRYTFLTFEMGIRYKSPRISRYYYDCYQDYVLSLRF